MRWRRSGCSTCRAPHLAAVARDQTKAGVAWGDLQPVELALGGHVHRTRGRAGEYAADIRPPSADDLVGPPLGGAAAAHAIGTGPCDGAVSVLDHQLPIILHGVRVAGWVASAGAGCAPYDLFALVLQHQLSIGQHDQLVRTSASRKGPHRPEGLATDTVDNVHQPTLMEHQHLDKHGPKRCEGLGRQANRGISTATQRLQQDIQRGWMSMPPATHKSLGWG